MLSGINHIEIWVSDLKRSLAFYKGVLELIEWKQISTNAIATNYIELYFIQKDNLRKVDCYGIRHLCFQATKLEQLFEIRNYLLENNTQIIRGPIGMPYSDNYHTIDFYDPDGLILEVAYTPNMKFIED